MGRQVLCPAKRGATSVSSQDKAKKRARKLESRYPHAIQAEHIETASNNHQVFRNCDRSQNPEDPNSPKATKPYTLDLNLLVGYHGEPKVGLFHNIRII